MGGFASGDAGVGKSPGPGSKPSETVVEGCLSVDGFAALVARSHAVEVSGVDQEGTPCAFRAEGWPARILQHELDHLDGTLYIDRMLSRSFSTVDALKGVHAGKSVDEIARDLGAYR